MTNETKHNHRQTGLLLIGFGCLLFLVFAGWPLYRAHHGASQITFFSQYIGVGVLLIVAGINFLLGVDLFDWYDRGDTKLSEIKVAVWLKILANIGIVAGASFLFDYYLKSLGYLTTFSNGLQ